GAVPSGPDELDRYQDEHIKYQYTEPTQDHSANTIGLIAGLIEYYGSDKFKPFTDCNLDLGFGRPNSTQKPSWPDDDCYRTCNTGPQCNYGITVFGAPGIVAKPIETMSGSPNLPPTPTPTTPSSAAHSHRAGGVMVAMLFLTLAVSYLLPSFR